MLLSIGDRSGPSRQASSGPDARREVTMLLAAHHRGDRGAFERLVPLVYEDLRRIARRILRRARASETVSATVLVHEAYVHLVDADAVPWQGRTHFFAVAARSMRRLLVDFARRRSASKRGGGVQLVSIDDEPVGVAAQAETVLAIERALETMAAIDQRLVDVIECRLFAGLTEEETAQTLGMSLRTVQRTWQRGRAWLVRELPPP
jgi:RNA polymerase sigma factor (TIGR02999 family)